MAAILPLTPNRDPLAITAEVEISERSRESPSNYDCVSGIVE